MDWKKEIYRIAITILIYAIRKSIDESPYHINSVSFPTKKDSAFGPNLFK